MKLFYNNEDSKILDERRLRQFFWLDDTGAIPIQEARKDDVGYFFAGNRGSAYYQRLVQDYPYIHDRPEERDELMGFDQILRAVLEAKVDVPMPRTWLVGIDDPLPDDLTFPLFVRTAHSSWKRGGDISQVKSPKELQDEMYLLRRAMGWDEPIVLREWLELAVAGYRCYRLPQEIRVWIVNHEPWAWSFHHLHLVPEPEGFPPSDEDLAVIREYASRLSGVFRSRLFVADFVRDTSGHWHFLEADPGSCAGTGHEAVYKSVALRLLGEEQRVRDDHGGTFVS